MKCLSSIFNVLLILIDTITINKNKKLTFFSLFVLLITCLCPKEEAKEVRKNMLLLDMSYVNTSHTLMCEYLFSGGSRGRGRI